MSKSMRTIIFKLYKPGKQKRMIIDEAMQNYSNAFQFMLDSAYKDIENIKNNYKDDNGKYWANYLAKWVDKDLNKKLNDFNIEPFKDSINIDFGTALAGYLNARAKGKKVNYPSSSISKEEMDEKYSKIMSEYLNEKISYEKMEKVVTRLINKSERLRPLFFCRYDISRNYCIMYNPENGKYYAKVYMMNSRNENRKKPNDFSDRVLIYINKNQDFFKERGGKRTFVIFPLSFGKWQENYLKEAMDNPNILKTARIMKKGNEYYFGVNIVKERPQPITAVNYMGICRGIQRAVNYSIVNSEGELLSEGSFKEDDLNITANEIVKKAYENKCHIIMEKLIDKGDKLKWKGKDGVIYVPVMDCIEYNELVNILSYKIPDTGLPNIVRVSSRGIFYTCPNCGINTKANRFSNDILICTSCGTTIDVEKAGALNLARRLIKYSSDTIPIIVENTANGVRFVNHELNFEYYPTDPYNCGDEFMNEIDKVIKAFYSNMDKELKDKNFKKKFSLIKKIEGHRARDIFELITEITA